MADAWAGKLSYKQRMEVMRKYGMSPQNYASLELANHQLKELVTSSNLGATIEAQEAILTEAEGQVAALEQMSRNMPDGSVFAATQLLNSNLAGLQRMFANLHVTLTRSVALSSQQITAQESEKMIKQQQEYVEKKQSEREMGTTGIVRDVFVY